jgi:hypothetical protein
MSSNNTSEELEQLKARVGWLDHLDTEEGRRMHANEALLVEIERLKAENEKLKESDRELKEEIKYILSNCQPLSVLTTQEKLHWVTCSINLWSKLK